MAAPGSSHPAEAAVLGPLPRARRAKRPGSGHVGQLRRDPSRQLARDAPTTWQVGFLHHTSPWTAPLGTLQISIESQCVAVQVVEGELAGSPGRELQLASPTSRRRGVVQSTDGIGGNAQMRSPRAFLTQVAGKEMCQPVPDGSEAGGGTLQRWLKAAYRRVARWLLSIE
jgi:hypothetical protein